MNGRKAVLRYAFTHVFMYLGMQVLMYSCTQIWVYSTILIGMQVLMYSCTQIWVYVPYSGMHAIEYP